MSEHLSEKDSFETPFFSIVVPTYNRAHLITNTLNSIFAQSFTNFELILVDDGSTDNTTAIVEQHFADEKRLRYHKKINEERSVARNTGIKLAKGKYVLFFDSDDFMQAHHLATLRKTITSHPEAIFLATKFEFENDGITHPSHIAHLPEGFYEYKLLLEGSYFGTLVCFKRSILDNNPQEKKFQFFPKAFNICEDWIFLLLNLYQHQLSIYLIDQTTITVNDHPERSMADNQTVISARLEATNFLLKILNITSDEEHILNGHSYLFCAVHAYLDYNRRQAWGFLKLAIKHLGNDRKTITLGIKIILGKKLVEKFRRYN